ncbi:MAG TPA: hypothetical protein VGZ69_04475 [Candidatus Rhabdochlamydia sp.]|nr:hypothetical protein [Candidatus Rhabdochlamydia sp.]
MKFSSNCRIIDTAICSLPVHSGLFEFCNPAWGVVLSESIPSR